MVHSGTGTASTRTVHADLPVIHTLTNLENHSFTINNRVRVSDVSHDSTFVWVGIHGLERVPWGELRARGVRTVYYQTEPIGRCPFTNSTVDELWDFAWFNLEKCQRNPSSPILVERGGFRTLHPKQSRCILEYSQGLCEYWACHVQKLTSPEHEQRRCVRPLPSDGREDLRRDHTFRE